MGADGGSIPTRKELVGEKQATEKLEDNHDVFRVCSITGKPLDYTQLVCDYHGKLYNKESVLEYLLSKSKSIPQIHTLKDITCIKPDLVDDRWKCILSRKDVVTDSTSTKFACCPCGHVVQASLIEKTCPLCKNSAQHPIILNASGSDLLRQQKQFLEIKKQRRALKNKLKK